MDSQTRQEYIKAAVTFLQNSKLADSSLTDKLTFLKNKGLTQVEVDEALNLALINRHQPSTSGKWNFLIMLGLCYGGYRLYQGYLETRVDQKPKQEKSPTLEDVLNKIVELKKLIELQRKNITSDVQSIKTLLLGHEKFVAPPVIPEWQLKDNKE